MSELKEVFGTNYNLEACYQRLNYSAMILAVNIAKLNFKIRHESDSLWNGNNMRPEAIKLILIRYVKSIQSLLSILLIRRANL